MKNKITNIMKYILDKYPYKSELSASRLTKIFYLSDWKSAIENNKQITNVIWHFNHYGPYVDDFIEIAKKDEDIEVKEDWTMFGSRKTLINLKKSCNKKIDISDEDKKIIDYVIDATKNKNYEDFIKLVYSTYPVMSSDRYSDLNLIASAQQYKELLSRKNN
jgi:hypothetical protein